MNNQEEKIFELINDFPIAYKPILAKALKSVTAGLLLSQFLYWTKRKIVEERDGWFYKGEDEICEETGMTIEQQRTARKTLSEYYILETKKIGLPAKNWYRLDIGKLVWLIDNYLGTTSTSGGETRALVVGKPDNILYTENTTEIVDESEKEVCYFGFPLPVGWKEVNLGFDSDNADEPNVYLKNEWGEKVKQSEIKKRRVQYLASQKSKVTREKHADPVARDMVETLKTEQNLTYLDGGDNLKHAVAFKIKFCEHLVKDMGVDSSQLETRVLANFRAFLGHVKNQSPFHWKNMTNFGYMDRNFNKIIRDLK